MLGPFIVLLGCGWVVLAAAATGTSSIRNNQGAAGRGVPAAPGPTRTKTLGIYVKIGRSNGGRPAGRPRIPGSTSLSRSARDGDNTSFPTAARAIPPLRRWQPPQPERPTP